MRNNIKMQSFLTEVNSKISNAVNLALEEAMGELEAQTKRNTKVDTGKTKGSWEHKVDKGNHIGYVGSNYDNAIWEELGTGIYAQNGNGRKTAWTYRDIKGNYHRTRGKKPRRMLQNAMNDTKPKIANYFKRAFKNV